VRPEGASDYVDVVSFLHLEPVTALGALDHCRADTPGPDHLAALGTILLSRFVVWHDLTTYDYDRGFGARKYVNFFAYRMGRPLTSAIRQNHRDLVPEPLTGAPDVL